MKVFITGGTGFIGAHLIKALIEAGHHVLVLVDLLQKQQSSFGRSQYFQGRYPQP